MFHSSTKKLLVSLLLTCTLIASCLAIAPPRVQASAATSHVFPNAIYKNFVDEIITRGITHTKFEVFDLQGWLKGNILTVDLQDINVKTDILHSGVLTDSTTPQQLAENAKAIATVNGDFFDIGRTRAPIGPMIQGGQVLKTGQFRGHSAGVSRDGLGSIFHLNLSGLVTNTSSPDTSRLQLGGINEYNIKPNMLYMFTPYWGPGARTHIVKDHPHYAEVVVRDNRVVDVLDNQLYSGILGENMYLLLGAGAAADIILEGYKAGDILGITMDITPSYENLQFAIGGDVHLVIEGRPQKFPTNTYRHPRTGMGFSADKKTMYLVVIDGRQQDSRGMSYDEMAEFMASLGASNAINLDSGGSTQMLARPLGENQVKVVNSPSDGRQRGIPNAVGLFTTAPQGLPSGFKFETISSKVLSGLTRTFSAKLYDEFYNPIKTYESPYWSISKGEEQYSYYWHESPYYPQQGEFIKDGVFKGGEKGQVEILVQASGAESRYEVEVLGTPVEILPSIREINVEDGKVKNFKVYGRDEDGYQAIIEPRDITLRYDESLVTVRPQGNSGFQITPKMKGGSATIEIQVGDLKTYLGVTAGLIPVLVNDFEDISQWAFTKYPDNVSGAINRVGNPKINGRALRLDYNFTKTDENRAAYINASPKPHPLPEGTARLGLQVYGKDGKGHWLRGTIIDSTGKSFTIDFAKEVNWEGWKYVETGIPADAKQPLALEKIYFVAADPENRTSGCIIIDDLTARIPTTTKLPATTIRPELIAEIYPAFQPEIRFAVISNLALDANNPMPDKLDKAGKALSKAQNQGIDFVIFAGNTVASDTAQNYEYAQKFLKESLGSSNYYIVPGNKDIKGTNSLNRFRQTFGEDIRTFDHKGTRFVLLNMASGSLLTSNNKQWPMLQQALSGAETDPWINNLVVVNATSLPDTINHPASGTISDHKEAGLIKKLLEEFRQDSNKPVAFISGLDSFEFQRLDGVSYVGTGASCPVFNISSNAEHWLQVVRE